jgi:Pyruvate/2-oxoacid:ferredoxin oxidoreductase delta subunit
MNDRYLKTLDGKYVARLPVWREKSKADCLALRDFCLEEAVRSEAEGTGWVRTELDLAARWEAKALDGRK